MKYLKRFIESETTPVNGSSKSFRFKNLPHRGDPIKKDGKISIFQQDWFEKLLPDTLKLISDQKSKKLNQDLTITDTNGQNEYTFDKNECTIQGDLVQFTYYYNAMQKDKGEVSDGEPSMLEFDIHFVKNTRGIKLLVDITYGDKMAVEFSIESPNKINIIHYNGIGSKFDIETHWGFKQESIEDLVKFFNSFSHGIKLTTQDLSFIDEYLDSYSHDINNKDHYYTDDSKLMPWGNSLK